MLCSTIAKTSLMRMDSADARHAHACSASTDRFLAGRRVQEAGEILMAEWRRYLSVTAWLATLLELDMYEAFKTTLPAADGRYFSTEDTRKPQASLNDFSARKAHLPDLFYFIGFGRWKAPQVQRLRSPRFPPTRTFRLAPSYVTGKPRHLYYREENFSWNYFMVLNRSLI